MVPLKLSLAGLALLTGAPLLGDSTSAAPPVAPGFRNVAIKRGDQTLYIQVRDQTDPFKGVKKSDENNPDHFSFNQTSPMAHQSYDTGNTASSHDSGVYRQGEENTFLTKSYFDRAADAADTATPGLRNAVPTRPADEFLVPVAGYDKGFSTARADIGPDKFAGVADKTSSYQGQSAVVGGHDVEVYSSSLAGKTFHGAEADSAKRDLAQVDAGMVGLQDLPNRPLTIDEVRALINHGIKPQTDQKPPEPSKALDDPTYMPDPAPAPLRAQPGDEHHLLDDNDMIPTPGAIAHPEAAVVAPEDSEPLPK